MQDMYMCMRVHACTCACVCNMRTREQQENNCQQEKHHLLLFCMVWKAAFQLQQYVQFSYMYTPLYLMEININIFKDDFFVSYFWS